MRVNPAAVEFAKDLIFKGGYRISTLWQDNKISEQAKAAFIATQGLDQYALWHLVEDDHAAPDSPTRYRFLMGDFQSIHRSALVRAHDQAVKDHDQALIAATDDILFLFDRLTAC